MQLGQDIKDNLPIDEEDMTSLPMMDQPTYR